MEKLKSLQQSRQSHSNAWMGLNRGNRSYSVHFHILDPLQSLTLRVHHQWPSIKSTGTNCGNTSLYIMQSNNTPLLTIALNIKD